jgi:bifunctional enzyme CysN/CysC
MPLTEPDLLRLSTAGSVDDGKSTLIGRLLYDTKSIFEDQLEAVERASRQTGETHLNLALLTDGLRAEREQKITIDVAYRYFATPKRKFIIADTPGHLQYTRNMVTGASTAELAIVLVDARKGVLTQSKRHGFIASLLRIPHIVVCVNKMDLVDWDEGVYDAIVRDFRDFAEKLAVPDIQFIPISALEGDNVVTPSGRMPWYAGGPLLHLLETVNVGSTRNLVDFRFPVQHVIRPNQSFRGFAGRIVSGTIQPGEEVAILPSGHLSRVRSVESPDGALEEGVAGDSVVLTLDDEVDVSRGEMIVRRRNLPVVANRFDALICWMDGRRLDPETGYLLFQTTRSAPAFVTSLIYRIDVDTLHREEATSLGLNEIGRVEVTTSIPIFFDPYDRNRNTGSFILIDPRTNSTVAAGMITGEVRQIEEAALPAVRVSPDVRWEDAGVSRGAREDRNGHRAAVLWFTGLSGAGKTTIARELERRLFAEGRQVVLLDGDQLRHGLCGDLGFSQEDRAENIRRAGEVAKLFFEAGHIVLCAFVSPYRDDRQRVRAMFPEGSFAEIHVDCDLATLRARDTKGLYGRAEQSDAVQLTGVRAPYEVPEAPELSVSSAGASLEECVAAVDEVLFRMEER